MSVFLKKYLKTSLCFVLILSIFLQSFPLQANAFSISNTISSVGKFIGKIYRKITLSLPGELILTDEADIKLGRWNLTDAFGIDCIYKKNGKCINPFSVIDLGVSDTISLVDAKGALNIVIPKIPEVCELKIPLPGGGELSAEEKIALRKACSALISLQNAAAKQAYSAKELYNNTDPLSSCLFLKNCKSSCTLRLGEISYTINLVRILAYFAPYVGQLAFIKDIAEIINAVVDIVKVVKAVKQTTELIGAAVSLVNNLFASTVYIITFYQSMHRIINVVSDEGFKNLLGFFSDNLTKFSSAKSRAMRATSNVQNDTSVLINNIQNTDGVRFLFQQNSSKRNELDRIIYEYLFKFHVKDDVLNSVGVLMRNRLPKTIEDEDEEKIKIDIESIVNEYIPASKIPPVVIQGKFSFEESCTQEYYDEGTASLKNYKCEYIYAEIGGDWLDKLLEIEKNWNQIRDDIYNAPYTTNPIKAIENIRTKIETFIVSNMATKAMLERISPAINNRIKFIVEINIESPDEWDSSSTQVPGTVSKFIDNWKIETIIKKQATRITNPKEPWENQEPFWQEEIPEDLYLEYGTKYGENIDYSDTSVKRDVNSPEDTTIERLIGDEFLLATDCLQKDPQSCCNPLSLNSCTTSLDTTDAKAFLDGYSGIALDPNKLFNLLIISLLFSKDGRIDSDFWNNLVSQNLKVFNDFNESVEISEYDNLTDYLDNLEEEWEKDLKPAIEAKEKVAEAIDAGISNAENISLIQLGLEEIKFRLKEKKDEAILKYLNEILAPVLGFKLESVPSRTNPPWFCQTIDARTRERTGALSKECKTALDNAENNEELVKFFSEALDKVDIILTSIQTLRRIWYPETETEGKIISLKQYIKDAIQTKELSETINQQKEAITSLPSEYSLEEDERRILSLSLSDIQQVTQPLIDIIGTYECPDTANPEQGFLNQLKCFEINNYNRTFEKMEIFLALIEKLEDLIEKFTQVITSIVKIQPTVDIQPLELDPDVDLDEILEGKNPVHWEERAGADSFDNFKEKVVGTPYSFIKKLFDTAKTALEETTNSLADSSHYIDSNKGLLGGFEASLINIQDKTFALDLLIFGDDNLRKVCKSLDLILRQDPLFIKENCQNIDNDINDAFLALIDFQNKNKTSLEVSHSLSAIEELTKMALIEISQDDPKIGGWIKNILILSSENPSLTDEEATIIIRNVVSPIQWLIINKELVPNSSDFQNMPSEWWEDKICSRFAIEPSWPDIIRQPSWPDIIRRSVCNELSDKFSQIKTSLDFYIEKNDEEKTLIDELHSLQDVQDECEAFSFLEKSLKNNCQDVTKQECNNFFYLRGDFSSNDEGVIEYFCTGKNEKKLCQDTKIFLDNQLNPPDGIPDITEEENKDELNRVRKKCTLELNDIQTPLENVMKVFAILLAIKSGTLGFKTVKASWNDAKEVYEKAQELIAIIKGSFKIKSWELGEVGAVGFNVDPFKCTSNPATGYKGRGGPQGGPVCPDVNRIYSTIESYFNTIRQKKNYIDLVRKEKEKISIGGYDIPWLYKYENIYNSEQIKSVQKKAGEIKEKAMNLWALATAINFASKNCTCGQSYCQLPMCISGVPLTPDPIGNPYCYLTYILRWPMNYFANKLENSLK